MPRRTVAGATVWITVAQFFVMEELVRRGWSIPYSRRTNYVSDLGATECGPYFDRKICSPDHVWMNLSFCLVGVAIIVGTMLLVPAGGLLRAPMPVFYVTGGVGAVLVGLFQLDVARPVHALGAGMFLVGTHLAHALLGWRLFRRGRVYGIWLIVIGLAGLSFAALVAAGSSLGVGVGFVQRLTAYASVIGIIASAVILLVHPVVDGAGSSPAADG